MKKFSVSITEILCREVEIYAESDETAEQKISDQYFAQKIILGAEDIQDVEFRCEDI